MDTKLEKMFAEIGLLANLTPEMMVGLAFARLVARVVDAYAYPIEDGCIENLDYETHKRGTNWIAFVTPNRAAPGGLDRSFWKHGSGRWFKAPRDVKAGDVIEMAGDYSSARGSKTRDRRYVLVVRNEGTYFVGAYIGDTAPSARKVETERKSYGLAA